MNCKEARSWMSPYLDSELGQTKTFEVSEHLRRCPECAVRFGAEREVDNAMRSRLGHTAMPAERWSGFRRELTVPSWVRRLGSRRGLALAACLAIAVISSIVVLQPRDERMGIPAIANRFLAEAPENQPFPVSQPGIDSANEVVRNEYGMRLASATDVEAMGHRDFQLVSASRRTDEAGRPYVEVRLNCCGQPVLVTLARPIDGELPTPFAHVLPGHANSPPTLEGGVKLAHASMGGVHIVAASRHSVEHIVGSLLAEDA